MNRKVILHKSAVEELNLIKQRVYELFGYNVANKVVKNLIHLMNVLSVNPYLGTKDERYSPFLTLHSKHNRIFYLVEDNEIIREFGISAFRREPTDKNLRMIH